MTQHPGAGEADSNSESVAKQILGTFPGRKERVHVMDG